MAYQSLGALINTIDVHFVSSIFDEFIVKRAEVGTDVHVGDVSLTCDKAVKWWVKSAQTNDRSSADATIEL